MVRSLISLTYLPVNPLTCQLVYEFIVKADLLFDFRLFYHTLHIHSGSEFGYIGIGLQTYANRYALFNLYKVARGIVLRNDGIGRPCGVAYALNLSLKLHTRHGIGFNVYLIACGNVWQLCFAVVGHNPNV